MSKEIEVTEDAPLKEIIFYSLGNCTGLFSNIISINWFLMLVFNVGSSS